MITAARNGAALPDDWSQAPLTWSARIAFTNGAPATPAGFSYYEIPATALISRSRRSTLDGRSWALELELLEAALPPFTEPLPYYQVELDMVDRAGNAWPYFTGPIIDLSRGYTEQGGAIVETVRLACEGTLARARGFRANTVSINPITKFAYTNVDPDKLTGYVVRIAVQSTVSLVGGTYQARVHGSSHSYNITDSTSANVDFRGIYVATDAAFTTIVAPASYTVTTPANSDAILDFGAVSPGATVYIAYWRPAHWAIPYWRDTLGSAPDWILIPYPGITYTGTNSLPKRRVFDTFQTYAATGTGNGAAGTPILVQDPGPYTTGAGIVAVTGGPTEILAWTRSDGIDEFRTVSSVNAAGAITLTAGFSAVPAVGDPIRLATAEIVRSWDLHNEYNGTFPNVLRNLPVRFFRNNAYATELEPYVLEAIPTAGMARPLGGSATWLSAAGYLRLGAAPLSYLNDIRRNPFVFGLDNTVESVVYSALVDNSLFQSSDIVAGNPSGSFCKGAEFWNTTLEDAIKRVEEDTLAPNAFVHDRPDGKVVIGGYEQSSAPAIFMRDIIAIDQENAQETTTAASVISIAQESANIIKSLNPRFETGTFSGINASLNWIGRDWTNFTRLFDGNLTNQATATMVNFSDVARLVLEVRHKPRQIFPLIEKIVIYNGIGTLKLFARGLGETTKTVSDIASSNKHVWQLTGNGQTTIDGEIINSLLADVGIDLAELVLDFGYPSSGTTVGAAEVEVYAKRQAAWTAFISDDTTGSPPTGWATPATGSTYGPSFWQRDLAQPQSYRFAPTDTLKRLSPVYSSSYANVRHRMEVYELSQLSQDECRDYAEQFLNQALAGSSTYRITAVMDPRIDLGDTVAFPMPDGSVRSGIVWAIDDSGGADDRSAVYTLLDYSV